MGHLYTGHGDIRTLARNMLDSWDIDLGEIDEADGRMPSQFLRTRRERFSTPHVARDPGKNEERELDVEDPSIMLRHPPSVGAVRFYHEPGSTDTSHAGMRAITFQGITSIITPRGPCQIEGARWHLLTQVFSTAASFNTDMQAEILLQESLDSRPKYRSFSWQSLRQAQRIFGAETYVGETGLTTPPFFANARRGPRAIWGEDDNSPIIVNWNGLDASEQSDIIPILLATTNWILLTHPLGSPKSITPPFPSGARRVLHTKGNACREKGWWKTGTDKLASHGLDTEVWVSSLSKVSRDDMLDLEEILNSGSTKDLPDMRADGVEEIYWAGTETGLMDILNFPGVVYATDGSKSSNGMGAGFYRHDTRSGGCCRVGGGPGGGSSGRAEFGAAVLALEDSLTHDKPIAIITDSKGLMTVSAGWVGEGKDPLLRHSPDGDILACIISLLQQRVALGLFTIFIKIRAHRGEFFNEKADRWADEGREDKDNVRWGGPSLRPIFSWIEAGIERRCSLNKTLRAIVHTRVAELQLPLHDNFTSKFLKRADNSRALLGKHWLDKSVPDASKRRLIQSLGFQFPCAKMLKLWGIRGSDECRLCKRLFPKETAWPESLGHIQARCPVLRKPRIAVHHGIWRELLTAIDRNSSETNEDGTKKWFFPSAVNEATHLEWTVRQILVHLGLFSNSKRLRADIIEFHENQGIFLTVEEATSFFSLRPDGVAFNEMEKKCILLEFTRPMDSKDSLDEGDWADIKEAEKNARYALVRYFINWMSTRRGRVWDCTQINFTVGARGSIKQNQFQDRLTQLGVTCSKARENIRKLTVAKTLALSDIILKLFHVSIQRSPEWDLSSLPTALANSQTARFHLFKKFTGPFSGLVI